MIFAGTTESCDLADKLMEVKLPIVDDELCQLSNSNNGTHDNFRITYYLHLCAGFEEGGKDSCQVQNFEHILNRY